MKAPPICIKHLLGGTLAPCGAKPCLRRHIDISEVNPEDRQFIASFLEGNAYGGSMFFDETRVKALGLDPSRMTSCFTCGGPKELKAWVEAKKARSLKGKVKNTSSHPSSKGSRENEPRKPGPDDYFLRTLKELSIPESECHAIMALSGTETRRAVLAKVLIEQSGAASDC